MLIKILISVAQVVIRYTLYITILSEYLGKSFGVF